MRKADVPLSHRFKSGLAGDADLWYSLGQLPSDTDLTFLNTSSNHSFTDSRWVGSHDSACLNQMVDGEVMMI
jgi:hypothetical protein